MSDMKTKAGINTALMGVGTVGGGVALGVGIAKANVDKEQEALEAKVKKLIDEKSTIPIESIEIENQSEFEAQISDLVNRNYDNYSDDVQKISELEQKSKKLGNVRTGVMAGTTVVDAVGTIVSASNHVDEDLQVKVEKCKSEVKKLSNVYNSAKMESDVDGALLQKADKIISGCGDWESVDLSKINKRATGAAVSGGTGTVMALAGTVTSASANSDKVRNDDSDAGKQKEKNLNTASNILAGGAGVASLASVIFSATQISVIKKAVAAADRCEEALK